MDRLVLFYRACRKFPNKMLGRLELHAHAYILLQALAFGKFYTDPSRKKIAAAIMPASAVLHHLFFYIPNNPISNPFAF
mgnify:FL=1